MATFETSERLEKLGDTIIASMLQGDEESVANRRTVFGEIQPDMLSNFNYIIYKVFHKFKEAGFTPNAEFLQLILARQPKFILDSRNHIDVSVIQDTEGDLNTAYSGLVMRHYKELLKREKIDANTLKLNIEMYKQEWAQLEISRALSQAKYMLTDEVEIGKKKYRGYEDAIATVKIAAARIENVMDKTAGAGFIDSRQMALAKETVAKPEKIGDFGLVDELNQKLGGYFTSYFYNVIAPTKNGKSKWCARACHNMLMHGVNVSVWAHEGGVAAWWDQMNAIHFEYLNSQTGTPPYPLCQQEINTGTYPNEEIRVLAEQARVDLFTNENYGNLGMIDRPFTLETFIDEIETSVSSNRSRAVIIDYLQLIEWTTKGMSKPQAIGSAYQKLLAYAKKRNVLVMSPSQMTQEFMNEMAKSKDGQVNEIRTAGGESSEVIRTPDINIALYATVEDLQHNDMTILSVPSRLAQPFPPIRIYANLANCVFASKP